MTQKIIKVGNSYAVTIPRVMLNNPAFVGKEEVEVEAFPEEGELLVRFKPTKGVQGEGSTLTPEFLEWINAFNAKYKKVLTELAKK